MTAMGEEIPMDLSMSSERFDIKTETFEVKVEPLDSSDEETPSDLKEEYDVALTDNKEVWIKQELESFEGNSLVVKIEPDDSAIVNPKSEPGSEGEESPNVNEAHLIPRIVRRNNKKKLDIDDEYIPKKNGKKKKKVKTKQESNVKPTVKGKPRSDNSILYSDEVVKNIEIVTINEEERQIEHREVLAARLHMRFVCEPCAVGFVVEDAYMMHMKVHSPESGEHECDICLTRLRSADTLYRHRLRHYRRYRCTICSALHRDKDAAACHVMTRHQRGAFRCDQCDREFKRPAYLKRHVQQHHTKPLRLECAHCGRVFHERGWYRSHVRTHSEEVRTQTVTIKATCALCYREFKSKASLVRHLASHEAGRIRGPGGVAGSGGVGGVARIELCRLCATPHHSRDELRAHYREAHDMDWLPKPPEQGCPQCTRVLATPAMLRRHIKRMHTDRTKKYECGHCARSYLTKGEVRAHVMWSHLPVGAGGGHACSRAGCGRVFRTPALLRAHVARHEGAPCARPHKCDTCGKGFATRQVLRRHMKSHSNQMYPCNECGMLFKTEPYVKVHYKLKHLNMTRAEINAERKRKKVIMIDKNIDPNDKNLAKITESLLKKVRTNIEVNVDPLLLEIECNSGGDIEVDVGHVPLFETFIDVARDS